MQQNFSRAFLPLIFFILLSTLALAIDNCNEITSADNVPCLILLPYTGNCSNISVFLYRENTFLISDDMITYSPFICSLEFTYTQNATYNFNYSTGDSGVIVVTEGNKMIYLLYFGMILMAIMFFAGIVIRNHYLVAIASMLGLMIGFWITKNGFSIYSNVVTLTIGAVLIGTSGYFLVLSLMTAIEEDFD